MDFVRTGEPQNPFPHRIWLVAFEDTTGQILGHENGRGEETQEPMRQAEKDRMTRLRQKWDEVFSYPFLVSDHIR
jgi:hypothetical protein